MFLLTLFLFRFNLLFFIENTHFVFPSLIFDFLVLCLVSPKLSAVVPNRMAIGTVFFVIIPFQLLFHENV
jgi:hypothetical protein